MKKPVFPVLLIAILVMTFSSCKEDCEKMHTGTVEVTIGDDPCDETYDIWIAGIKEASAVANSTTSISGIPWGTRQVQIRVGSTVLAEETISVFTCNTTVVDFGVICGPSDERYKMNIIPFSFNAEDFMRIGSYVYQYRSDEFAALPEGTHTGFMAQELLEVYPHLVRENASGYYSVNYVEMIPILTKAIQEQQKEIDALKKEMEVLKASGTIVP